VDGKTDGTDSNGGEPEDSWSSQSPEELWLMLVGDIRETLKKVYLSACMLEGTPESLHDSVLTIAFDSEYEMISSSFVEDEINLLDMRLRDLTGDKNMKISLVRRQGLASPTQI